ncbi:MAG: DNA integrity scanning protein DisA nucleotide-binding domain protein, partial [Clostridia bacterium]|nr:DNA integrity scanning protein DisA nucleotide-binding domain protein [Clostridia bacterium]
MDWQQLVDAFIKVFTDFSDAWVNYLLEFVLLFLLIYCVLRVLSDNNAFKLAVFYAVAVVVLGIWSLVLPSFSEIIFIFSIFMLSMFMLLLFSMEIKRAIWAKGNVEGLVNVNKSTPRYSAPETEACIEAIIKACQNMSKNDVGALIVLSNGNLPKQILESGTIINAEISQQMIEGIFFPKAPLHDGALIVSEHKLLAAGCF